jgi:hypothetical protein
MRQLRACQMSVPDMPGRVLALVFALVAIFCGGGMVGACPRTARAIATLLIGPTGLSSSWVHISMCFLQLCAFSLPLPLPLVRVDMFGMLKVVVGGSRIDLIQYVVVEVLLVKLGW